MFQFIILTLSIDIFNQNVHYYFVCFMPRGVYIHNENTLETFRENILKSLPFTLHKKSNYNDFSDYVYARVGMMLSESTLRRLMQPKSRVKPTFATINAVAQSIGYENWDDFLQENEVEIEYLFLQEINMIEYVRTSDFNSWKNTIERYKGTKVYLQVYKRMVMLAIEDRNIEIITRAFEFPEIYKGLNKEPNIHFFVAVFMRKLQQFNLINPLIPHLAGNKYAQVHLIEWYVDEFNLPGYYGELIEHYSQHRKDPNDLLFYNSLMALRNLMLDLPADKFVNEISNLKENTYYHYYPKTRRLAILLLVHAQNEAKVTVYLDELVELLHKQDDLLRLNLGHFLCRILFVKRNAIFLRHVIELTRIRKNVGLDLFAKIDFNEILKYEAFCLYSEGKIEKSRATLGFTE